MRYDTYCDTGITIRYVSRYIYYPLIYEMQNCVIEVSIKIYYNIWGNTYHDTIFSLAIRIVGAVYRYIVIHWWIVTSLANRDCFMYHEQSKTGLIQYVWPALRSGFASGHRVALVVHRAQKSVPDSAGEWPTFSPPPLESCSGTTNVDGSNSGPLDVPVHGDWALPGWTIKKIGSHDLIFVLR